MYETYTYEYLLKSILDRITTADSSIDVREGSAMWYAVAPVAMELAIAYDNFNRVHKESFVGTATREGLYLACNDVGLDTAQFEATPSIFKGHFNIEVTIGSRWACGNYIFVAKQLNGTVKIDGVDYYEYILECETVGAHTAYTSGFLKPITDYGISNLKTSVLDECITVGSDEATDETIRKTYFDYVANNSDGGNVAQYHQWLLAFPGVGAEKVVAGWNGKNTVKAIILDENKEAPTPEFVASVQEYLDPNAEGLGEGKAPIGAVVTVEGGINANIIVEARVTLVNPTADISDVSVKLRDYFRSIAFKKSTISIYEVASIVLSSPAVSDVTDIQLGKFNEDPLDIAFTKSNLVLDETETPVLYLFRID